MQVLPAGCLGVVQQAGQGSNDVMLQKAFSGEEKLDLDTTKTKPGEDPENHPQPHWVLNLRWLLQTTCLWLPERRQGPEADDV